MSESHQLAQEIWKLAKKDFQTAYNILLDNYLHQEVSSTFLNNIEVVLYDIDNHYKYPELYTENPCEMLDEIIAFENSLH